MWLWVPEQVAQMCEARWRGRQPLLLTQIDVMDPVQPSRIQSKLQELEPVWGTPMCRGGQALGLYGTGQETLLQLALQQPCCLRREYQAGPHQSLLGSLVQRCSVKAAAPPALIEAPRPEYANAACRHPTASL